MATITKDDFSYGAALKQVADDRRFKPINAEWGDGLRTALEHREPRIPLGFGGTAVVGVKVNCAAALRRYYGLSPGPVKVQESYPMLDLVEDDLRAAMGIDITGVFPSPTAAS
jgi:hypothetical protein